jgi:hypothetical protein
VGEFQNRNRGYALKFPLISKLKAIASLVESCDGDAIDLREAKRLLGELEPLLARIEMMNFSKKVGR